MSKPQGAGLLQLVLSGYAEGCPSAAIRSVSVAGVDGTGLAGAGLGGEVDKKFIRACPLADGPAWQ